jgi:flavin reductase (DIM6/NTAB) family NADH-FMN oxidoreductase RutF
MANGVTPPMRALDPADETIWDRFFTVFPIVLIGTREADGSPNLAPKHMAMPIGWADHFGFVCTPTHGTYVNAKRDEAFTVSFPRPEQIVAVSLAAAPREADGDKPSLRALPVCNAEHIEGILLEGAYVHLECRLDRIVDGFGRASLIVGRVVGVAVADDYLRDPEIDDAELLAEHPPLSYVSPGRTATVSTTTAFPFHVGFKR